MLLRRVVNDRLGNGLIVWINPARIEYYVGKNVPLIGFTNEKLKKFTWLRKKIQSIITANTSFVVREKYYSSPTPIDKLEKFQMIKDLFQNREQYRMSEWYRILSKQIETTGMAKHKKIIISSKKDLEVFFTAYVLDIIQSMEQHGYLFEKGKKIGSIMIGAEGDIHKSNAGEHRFFIAKLLGLEKMPFMIKGVHEKWIKDRDIPKSIKALPQLAIAIKEVERKNR